MANNLDTLISNLSTIHEEVMDKVIPENIKEGVTIFGQTGSVVELQGETKTVTATTSKQIITPSTGKNGITQITVNPVTASIDPNITPMNIRQGVTVLGVTGNLEPDKPDQTKTCTPTTSEQTIIADTGYELGSVTVEGVTSSIDQNIVASNIKEGVTILGVTGTYTTVFPTISDMEASTLEEGTIATIYNTNYEGTYIKDGNNWIQLGQPVEEVNVMEVLNEVNAVDDTYEGLGATEQEIEEVFDEILGNNNQ